MRHTSTPICLKERKRMKMTITMRENDNENDNDNDNDNEKENDKENDKEKEGSLVVASLLFVAVTGIGEEEEMTHSLDSSEDICRHHHLLCIT